MEDGRYLEDAGGVVFGMRIFTWRSGSFGQQHIAVPRSNPEDAEAIWQCP